MSPIHSTYQGSQYAKLLADLQRTELDRQGAKILENELEQEYQTVIPLQRNLAEFVWLAQIQGVTRIHPSSPSQGSITPYPSQDILAGLNGQKIPLYYLIQGEKERIHLYIGTTKDNATATSAETVYSMFSSQYPGLELAETEQIALPLNSVPTVSEQELQSIRDDLAECQSIGMITGVPTPKGEEGDRLGTQIDRLIRGLYGTNWTFLVLAEPVEDSLLSTLELAVVEERLRLPQEQGIQEWQQQMGQPVAYHYEELLKFWQQLLEASLYEGGWWVQAYLASPNAATYQRAKGLVKGIFSGDLARLERIRVIDAAGAGLKAASFSPFRTRRGYAAHESPFSAILHQQFKYQTLVSSGQLSALIHLPQQEMPGYYLREVALFDVSSHVPTSVETLQVGEILDRGHPTGNPYRVFIPDLTRHCLLVGITGGGKTNTAFHLLRQLQDQIPSVPFLVIEPAKREYRQMLEMLDRNNRLTVFTVGREGEQAAPFRLNPFEIRPGVSVQTHIDLLKSVFNASFGMWSPLPQVLERAIHEIYTDKGWEPIHSTNDRATLNPSESAQEHPQWHPRAHPTLTDLYLKVAELLPQLGYDKEVTRNIKAALETRINSLRVGAKGMMLDTQVSVPIQCLLQQPTILELEDVGDDDEKAFIIGLILISLYESYRYPDPNLQHQTQQKPKDQESLRHLTVIEEAHRLLARSAATTSDAEAGNLRGKAVETFINMLSEVRAYGEGFLIAEQIPTKLAPDVVKNTALKIMHRIVANDDRAVMGGAMNLDEKQLQQVVSLRKGEAVVHGGGDYGDDHAILVKVPKAKGQKQGIDTDQTVRQGWERFVAQYHLEGVFTSYPTCSALCQPLNPKCVNVRAIAEDPEFTQIFASWIISMIAASSYPQHNPPAEEVVQFYAPVHRSLQKYQQLQHQTSTNGIRCILTHALYHYMDTHARGYGWPYQDAAQFIGLVLPALLETATAYAVQGEDPDVHLSREQSMNLAIGCQQYSEACIQETEPFYGCSSVCSYQQQCVCLYRYNVEPLLNLPSVQDDYQATKLDPQALIASAQRFTSRITQFPESEAEFRVIALCFLIQKTHQNPQLDPTSRRKLIDHCIQAYEQPLGR
ncbi:MAG: DUF87 domain-containing protein [Oculatellaceae cyanobacterium Prado106]|jgi:hypothetical protein|nr:DUF87 domain-containing protein [Oculatellaceae cyanobacterium Prado106]